jgi:hypothetical protein
MAAAVTGNRKPAAVAFEYGRLIKTAATNSTVSRQSTVPFTMVGIGNPQIITAAEKNLSISKSTARGRDIYWLQFVVNPREELRNKVQRLSFFVTLKTKGAETLELVPLRYGQERDIKEDRSIPEIKIETPQGGVSIGKILGQEISYKVLKPTVVGTGLQSSEFGWLLTDEALDMSAKRLIAIVSVPKEEKKLEFEMVITARLSGPLLGFLEGDTASSQPITSTTDLASILPPTPPVQKAASPKSKHRRQ